MASLWKRFGIWKRDNNEQGRNPQENKQQQQQQQQHEKREQEQDELRSDNRQQPVDPQHLERDVARHFQTSSHQAAHHHNHHHQHHGDHSHHQHQVSPREPVQRNMSISKSGRYRPKKKRAGLDDVQYSEAVVS